MSCNSASNELLIQLKREVEKLITDTTSKLLIHDNKIYELHNYIKNNLNESLRKLLDDMKISGEMSEIVTDTILYDIIDRIEKTNIYYDGINTSKILDNPSKTYYYLTTIPRTDSKGSVIPLKMGIANDDTTFSALESTLKHAWRKNATICINCGVFNVDTDKPIASIIYEGTIINRDIPTVTPEKYQYFAITRDNEYRVYPIGTTPEAMINDGVYYACCIFQSLILNGVPVTQTDLRVEPRQSIGFKANGDVVIISCDGRSSESLGMSYDDLARIHALNGSVNAYILDGGGSTATVLRGVKQNENIDYFTTDRAVGTFLYVTKDTNVSVENNLANDLGRVKQFLIGEIRKKSDFQRFIRILSPESYYAPGIEMYVNGEETRRSKLGLSFDSANPRNTYLYWGLKGPEDTSEKTNLFRIFPQGVWVQTYHGPSSGRPNGVVGLCYFDETIKKPIWFDGSKWVDSTGTAV